ncbi:hypothetical protein TNIN_390781 [Trichonephila inaurata madagascariensis]|uniref:Uncharacterized protein n=1 Tax=Trichonephila inaurata madagascariensis TaxID=2747483 RepID=A0A8X6M9C7_9ARAC|nr:hypothetical protein TNIN_390781 [Trichonephila inaurata madagascariensis]
MKKYRFPPSARQMFAFQHFSSPFGALTCTLRLRTGRGCAWDIQTHTQSLYGTQKGYVRFQHFSSPFGALPALGFGRGRGCAWDIQTHTRNPLQDTERCSPVESVR